MGIDGNGNGMGIGMKHQGITNRGNGNSVYFICVKIPRMIVKLDISVVAIKSAITLL